MDKSVDGNNVIEFALEFLRSNLQDIEVEAMLARHLGFCEDEGEYNGVETARLAGLVEEVLAEYQ